MKMKNKTAKVIICLLMVIVLISIILLIPAIIEERKTNLENKQCPFGYLMAEDYTCVMEDYWRDDWRE